MGLKTCPWLSELSDALSAARQNLPNGLLIYGPKGIGKIELVIRFAQSLFCEHPSEAGEPCGECKGCRMAMAKTHPDLRYVFSEVEAITHDVPFEPPSNATKDRKVYREILIHQPRELADFLNLAPHVENGHRAIIVYPADAIRADAAATFLKSLEEPPERTTFFLVANDLDRVLPTIRSRCRLLRAKAPTHEQALQWLKEKGIADAEEALSRAGDRPYLVIQEARIRETEDIDAKVREQLLTLSTISPEARKVLLKTLQDGAEMDLTQLAVKEGRTALPVSSVLPVLERWAYDLVLVKTGLLPHYYPELQARMVHLVEKVDIDHLFKWSDSLKQMRRVMTHPLNPQLVLEQCLLNYRRVMNNQSFD